MKLIHYCLMLAILIACVGCVNAYETTLTFEKGWNTVSTPFDADANDEELYTDVISGLVYNNKENEWESVESPEDGIIPATTAIFICCDNDGGSVKLSSLNTEPLVFDDPSDQSVYVELAAGMNFVGVSPRIVYGDGFNTEQLKISNAFGGNVAKIISPSANDGYSWETTDENVQLSVFKGYWVYCSDNTGFIKRYWV